MQQKKIFLIDGSGAVLSTLLLTGIALNNEFFGLQFETAKPLLLFSALLACFSLTVYILNPAKLKVLLQIIATANLLYCFFTVYIVVQNYGQLSKLTVVYFIAELIVIVYLAIYEIYLAVKT